MEWKPDTDYIMTTAGELEEADKYSSGQTPGGVYEYNQDRPERKVDSLRQQIEERERQLQEERRKLEEMQNDIRRSNLKEPVKQKEANTVLMAIPFGPLVI
jgi:uncharacterized protein YlxW (UPF0749 family)